MMLLVCPYCGSTRVSDRALESHIRVAHVPGEELAGERFQARERARIRARITYHARQARRLAEAAG